MIKAIVLGVAVLLIFLWITGNPASAGLHVNTWLSDATTFLSSAVKGT